MAARLLCGQRRAVAYLPSLQAMVQHFRAFSSYDENKYHDGVTVYEANVGDAINPQWPDDRFGPLAAADHRFPLPGNVGSAMPPVATGHVSQSEPDLLTSVLPQERQISILQQYLTIPREPSSESCEDAAYSDELAGVHSLECQALDCPALLRQDFQDLFPARDLSRGQLTVLTISQHTQNDMSCWSPDVEEERECLVEQFITSAQEMCGVLNSAGYWADFIDPTCGKPYLSEHTNTSMFETDERYRLFGFEVEDLGCCKVIQHHVWGTHAYVSCLFTDAPPDHPIIKQMMQKKDEEEL